MIHTIGWWFRQEEEHFILQAIRKGVWFNYKFMGQEHTHFMFPRRGDTY